MAAYRTILFLVSNDSGSDEVALRKLHKVFVTPSTAVYMLYVAAHHVTGFGHATARGHIANDMEIKQQHFPRLKTLCERYDIPPKHIHIDVGEPLAIIERYVRELGIEMLVVFAPKQADYSKLVPLLENCPCDLHIIR